MNKKYLGLIIVFLGLIGLFQNCDKSEVGSADSSSTNSTKTTSHSSTIKESPVDDSGSSNQYNASEIADYDLNALPNINPSIKDGSNWPLYLSAPEGCPAPNANKSYIHEGLVTEQPWQTQKKFLPGYEDHRYAFIRHGLSGGRRFWAVMKLNQQEYAVPVFTPTDTVPYAQQTRIGNVLLDANAQSGEIPGANVVEIIHASISYCPGDYSNTTPKNKSALNASCVSKPGQSVHIFLAPQDSALGKKMRAKGMCVLEPGEKYFYNLKLEGKAPYIYTGTENVMDWKGGEPLAVYGGEPDTLFRTPYQYTGPCISKGNAYPVGYDSVFCGESSIAATQFLKEGDVVETTCYDPYNKSQPSVFKKVFTSGKSKIVEGYGQGLLSRMLCETKTNGSNIDLKDRVCAAHREGEFRKEVQTGVYKYTGVQQCQFNPKLKRFEWTRVYASELVRRSNQAVRFSYAQNDLSFDHVGCKVGNTVHPYGTQVTIDCGKGSRKDTAQALCVERKTQDGSNVLAGTFEFVNGYIDSIPVVVDRDDRCTYTYSK